jgi:hypothetical protein
VEASVPIILFVYEQKLFNAMPCQRKEFIWTDAFKNVLGGIF